MDDIGLDAHERTGEPEYDPWWDDERMSAAMYGGHSFRECRHGYYPGECPTCNGRRVEDRPSDW